MAARIITKVAAPHQGPAAVDPLRPPARRSRRQVVAALDTESDESSAASGPIGRSPMIERPAGSLSLKAMVNGAKTTPRAVRFYEAEGLILPAARSPGGHRLFAGGELDKLRLIIDLRTCGFSIDEIRAILQAKSRGSTLREAAQAVQELLSSHVRELHAKIETIERLGREFHASVEVLERCVHCTEPRGIDACSTCDVPRQAGVPPSFHQIWPVARADSNRKRT